MNKSNAGVMVLVELQYNAEDAACKTVSHTISNNYFYKYAKTDTSLTNAGDSETIRLGASDEQNVNNNTTVKNNYFVEADGENEIITNKSKNNIFTNNTFRRCQDVKAAIGDEPGHEGYVGAGMKFVDRMRFSQANFAQNNPGGA